MKSTARATVADVTLTAAAARAALEAGILADQRAVAGTDSHGKIAFASAIPADGKVVGSESSSRSQGPDETTLSQVSSGVIDAIGAVTPLPAVGTAAPASATIGRWARRAEAWKIRAAPSRIRA